jgi:diaminopimelate epimerase
MTHQAIHFTKMHGLGNDFMIINNLDQTLQPAQLPITDWSNRYTGIGFDQLLLIEPSSQADFYCRIFNADGSEAEQCGNGLRCVARFVHENQIIATDKVTIETKAGVFPVTIKSYQEISVAMGQPQIKEPLVELAFPSRQADLTRQLSIISMGNPHAILKVNSIEDVSVSTLGAEIAAHSRFPQGANVGFMEVITPNHIRLRTYERGSGETHACGSNACAAVIAGIANHWLADKIKVEFGYGSLWIETSGIKGPLRMTGPADYVFSGLLELNNRHH